MNPKTSYMLMDEYPLLIVPSLAVVVGLNEAIVLQQVHYWLKHNQRTNRNFRNGYYWVYNTYAEWRKQFPLWTEITIKRIFLSLEKSGYLISDYFNKSKMDRIKWYRIDYDKLCEVRPSYQIDTMQESNLIRFYTETTTETNNGYNGIMVSSSDDNETETTISSQVSFSKPRKVDKEIVAFMNWYFAYYKRELGDEHPQLKTAKKHKVHDHLKAFRDEYCIDENGLKEMAEAFFKNVTTTDYNINHFVEPSILENRYYEALYRGSCDEWEE